MKLRALLTGATMMAVAGLPAVAAPAAAAPAQLGGAGSSLGYTVTVRTGDRSGAGTDANITIWVYGLKAISSKVKLDDSRDNFERDSTESFGRFHWGDLGRIDGIGLRKDGSGSAWYPEWVVVRNVSTGAWWFCSVATWYPGGARTNYHSCP
jgi:hypothetical protein